MHRNYLSEDIVDFTIVWKEELEDVTKVLEVAVRKPFSWEEEFERLETLSDVSGCSKQDEAMIFPEDIAAITNLEDTVNQIIFEEVHIAKGWAFKLPEVNMKPVHEEVYCEGDYFDGKEWDIKVGTPVTFPNFNGRTLCPMPNRWEMGKTF